jgi:GTP-binding protein EngB required for normal cell division
MDATLGIFNAEKERAIAIQEKLLDFLTQGEVAGVAIDPALKEKLRKSIEGSAKLRVALVGGFSEGKTSIAAAWLGKLDKSTMKISHQESSDAVSVFEVEDGLTLIDTPGLFGFKEKFNADTHEQEKYKDITKKYISEAHLVLYVMNSTNPLKESHREDLNWLFRDLSLLPRTIFVLSRFDEVADVEDEDDYQLQFAVKKRNVLSRLEDLIGLRSDEAQALSVVAVSANPFDAGVEHWLTDTERFKQLSHIPLLQQATAEKIKANGGLEKMALETSKSIIKDVLNREIPVAIEQDAILADELGKLSVAMDRAQKDISAMHRRINDTQVSLREFVSDHFVDLILQLDGTSLETVSDYFEREIGDGGIVLDTKIQNAFSKRVDAVNSELIRIQTSLSSDISAFDSHVTALGRQGLDYIVKSNVINAGTIKAARDVLFSSFKFKPWGAIKLANGLNGILSAAGILFEAWDSWKEAERLDAFIKAKAEMKKDLEGQRRELLGSISASNFAEVYFPDFVKLREQVASLETALLDTREQRETFAHWKRNAEAIDAEFTVLIS